MELSEIEAEADRLTKKLIEGRTNSTGARHDIGANEARDICFRLDGLSRAASIKATVAHQKRMAEQPILPGWSPTQGFGTTLLPNGPRCQAFLANLQCVGEQGHGGAHRDRDDHRWSDDPKPEPTKPVADRLHELVSFIRQGQIDAPFASREEVLDIADKLEKILQEGGL